ncbi:FecR family protein [Sphingomonas sp. PB4P5]|uniref:FecR family protein n=1 Tax=Parasphingomonas puruogangriensis TaxID=3096155 RepID=UPI002FC9711A
MIAGGMIATPPFGLWPSYAELMADRRTKAGERQAFSPVAGVQVELNSRSSLSTSSSTSGVNLIAGEVYVSVAPRQGAFAVQARDIRAASSGGSFAVRTDQAALCITCVTGTVASERAGRRTQIAAGEALTYGADGEIRSARVDASDTLAWRRGLLVFHGKPLGEALVEINRHFPGRLILTDEAKGGRLVTGVFHINQIELAVVQIQQLLDVSATRVPGGIVLLG